jgi:hypothetical protein
MTDLDRFVAFLSACGLPHKVLARSDVLMLPTENIAYVTYATKVAFYMLDGYFKEDGSLAGLARPKPVPEAICGQWDPVTHEPSGLATCRNCGWSEGPHRRGGAGTPTSTRDPAAALRDINAALWDPEERENLHSALAVEVGMDRADEVMDLLGGLSE